MIAYVRGELAGVYASSVVIEVAGIGYELFVTSSFAESLQGRCGEQIQLYTYMNVKEDGITLFGFPDEDARSVFKALITVSGIGPKGALGILSYMTTDDLRFAVLSEDAKTIAKAPGIGLKTAGKLILELKDKFKLEDAFESKLKLAAGAATGVRDSVRNDVTEALTALGYSASEAVKAVQSVEMTPDMTTDQLLKLSLKQI
jgi:holliday junction DNA helicase RuvA